MMNENNMPIHAVVLLSGGFDSVAALYWAKRTYASVEALTVAYGQPQAKAEMYWSGVAARDAGVEHNTLVVTEAFPRAGLLAGVSDHEERSNHDAAVVPLRNLQLLTIAAARAASLETTTVIVIGCCLEDQERFPDCRPEFLALASATLSAGAGKAIGTVAPWMYISKADIWAEVPEAHEALARSWSCYRGTLCGTCHACVVRARAFVGREDKTTLPPSSGGDVHRDLKLKS